MAAGGRVLRRRDPLARRGRRGAGDRLGDCQEQELWAERIERGLVHVTTITLLEAGYSARSASESSRPAPATFSRRWSTEEVPGMSRMFGARSSSQASATCPGVACSRAPSVASTGVASRSRRTSPGQPRGAKGTKAIFRFVHSVSTSGDRG